MKKTKRYYEFGDFLRDLFKFKVQKISINAGFTCPNRDGSKGWGGCTYCNNQTFSPEYCHTEKSVTEQLEEGVRFFSRKYPEMKYLAYFQAYTNTYAPIEYLRRIFTEAIEEPDVAALSIATRCDCLPPDVLDLLDELNRRKPVWIELGLQTIHDKTLHAIRSGFTLSQFEQAVSDLHKRNIPVITHLILGLPGETKEDMLSSVRYVGSLPVTGIKLQLLHILKGTVSTFYTGGIL